MNAQLKPCPKLLASSPPLSFKGMMQPTYFINPKGAGDMYHEKEMYHEKKQKKKEKKKNKKTAVIYSCQYIFSRKK